MPEVHGNLYGSYLLRALVWYGSLAGVAYMLAFFLHHVYGVGWLVGVINIYEQRRPRKGKWIRKTKEYIEREHMRKRAIFFLVKCI